MKINGYVNIACPSSIYCYRHKQVSSYLDAKALVGDSGIPFSFDSGYIYSLEPIPASSDDLTYNETISYTEIPHRVTRELQIQAITKKIHESGLTEKPHCLFFPKNDQSLPAKNLLQENLYINFGIGFHLLKIQEQVFFLIDPKMIVTQDGETWDEDFADANYSILNQNPMSYAQFKKIIEIIENILGNEFTIDFSIGSYKYKLAEPIDETQLKVTGSEPKVSFGTGKSHIFPAAGLKQFGPRDYNMSEERPSKISLGILSKDTGYPLLTRVKDGDGAYFHGFKSVYKTVLTGSKSWIVKITEEEIRGCNSEEELSQLFLNKLGVIKNNCDVYIIELPFSAPVEIAGINLRDFLKVLFWKERKASQIILENTETKYSSLLVDNLALGIYVSAGGQPWILEEPCENNVFIGVSFGKSRDNHSLIGTVEVFDSSGTSLGMKVSQLKTVDNREIDDRDLHLTTDQLKGLINDSLTRYTETYGAFPAKLTIHKTSYFNDQELEVLNVMKDLVIEMNLVYVSSKGKGLYLIPEDGNQPKRLRYWKPEANRAFLYTKGDDDGGRRFDPFIPKPMFLELQGKSEQSTYSIEQACIDIIKLTKLNWNSVATYEREPVTISHSRKLVNLLRAGLDINDAPRDVKYFI